MSNEVENPTVMYHQLKARNGQVFPAVQVPELERYGWVDTGQEHYKALPNKIFSR